MSTPTDEKTLRGTTMSRFPIAINSYSKGQNGETQSTTTYLDIICYAGVADGVRKYVSKGDALYIEARLKQDRWTDKNTGKDRSKLIIIAENIQYLSTRRDREQQPPAARRPQQQNNRPAATTQGEEEEDILF